MEDRTHRFGANGTHPHICVRCGQPNDHRYHQSPIRPPHIRWKLIFARNTSNPYDAR